jgi:hypothetical protein
MKRINLLQERTEAKRTEHEKLIISTSELSLDRIKSTRSTGTYASAHRHPNDCMQQIFVEWKQYEGYWDTEIGNQLFNRTELLTLFLRTASQGSTVLDLRILDCLGDCHDEGQKRLEFVFGIPLSAGDARSYMTLHSWITQKVKTPALLGDRFKLAQTL